MNKLSQNEKDRLHRQLIKLGDMMGDGLHNEEDGKWINKEYKKICILLGIIKKPKRNNKQINERVKERIATFKCPICDGDFRQVRSGSMVAKCCKCKAKYKILKKV